MGLLWDGKTSSSVPPAWCHCTQAADGHHPGDSSSQGMMRRSWQSLLARGPVRYRREPRPCSQLWSTQPASCSPCCPANWRQGSRQRRVGSRRAVGGDMAGDVPRCWDVAVGDIGLLQGSQEPSRIFPSPAQCHEASSPSSSAIRGAGCTSITHSLAKTVAKSLPPTPLQQLEHAVRSRSPPREGGHKHSGREKAARFHSVI